MTDVHEILAAMQARCDEAMPTPVKADTRRLIEAVEMLWQQRIDEKLQALNYQGGCVKVSNFDRQQAEQMLGDALLKILQPERKPDGTT